MLDCPPHIPTEFGGYCLTGLSTIYCYNPFDNHPVLSNDVNSYSYSNSHNDVNANIVDFSNSDEDSNNDADSNTNSANRNVDQDHYGAMGIHTNNEHDAESVTSTGNGIPPPSPTSAISPIGKPTMNHAISIIQEQIDEDSTDFISYFHVRCSAELLFFHQRMKNFNITPIMFMNSQSVDFRSLKCVTTIECNDKSLQKLLHFTISGIDTLTTVILHNYVSSNLLLQDNHRDNVRSSLQSPKDPKELLGEKEHSLLAYLQIYEPTVKDPPSFTLTQLCNLEELRVGVACGTNFETFSLSSACFAWPFSHRTSQTAVDQHRGRRSARR